MRPALNTPGFEPWFTGLSDGEGCFGVGKQIRNGCLRPYFVIALRDDDGPVLHDLKAHFGFGSISTQGPRVLRWSVQDEEGCRRLIEHFDAYPPRTKKYRDYVIWRDIVLAIRRRKRGDSWEPLYAMRDELMTQRQYQGEVTA